MEARRQVIALVKEHSAVFSVDSLNKKDVANASAILIKAVEKTIDPFDVVKDNLSYTFTSSLKSAVDQYFNAVVANEKENVRYSKETAKRDALIAKGKEPSYEISEKNIVDLDLLKASIIRIFDTLCASYEKRIAQTDFDIGAATVDVIDYLKEKASGVAYRVTKSMAKMRAIKLLKEVGIPDPVKRFSQYPFEFSGGMRQRIVIAIALSAAPDILVCDEPTTALDVTIQSQILELINKVKAERQLSVIFITHDLGVVANMADRVAVMYAGKIVEIGTADDVFYSPAHPYTWALLSSMPDLDTNEKLESIPGTPPNMIYPPKGDAFAERNKYAMEIDFELQPPMFKISDTHYAATWLLHPDAPKIDPPKAVTDRINRMKSARRKS
ncbi:MAG: ABC transporter ATP-binding protein [Clostridia bacterium]|nr:ABC transporter ATP-binding protein [Clostridia bacterium]